jgi:hypothetical protein
METNDRKAWDDKEFDRKKKEKKERKKTMSGNGGNIEMKLDAFFCV